MWKSLSLAVCGLLIVGWVLAQDDDAREDRSENSQAAAVERAVLEYAKAFSGRDAKDVARRWSPQAVHTDRDTGEKTTGRDAILADLGDFFAKNPKVELSIELRSVRLVRPDVAEVQGVATTTLGEETADEKEFSSLWIKDNGQWLLDSVHETSLPTRVSARDRLSELAWLVGSWEDETEDVRVRTVVRFGAHESFLVRSYTVEREGRDARQGTQVIGWDPRAESFRSWNFESDGSFGEGVWSKSGKEWLVKQRYTLSDGSVASGTQVITPIDDDSMTVQLVGHEVDGEPQPSLPAVRVVRAADEANVDKSHEDEPHDHEHEEK